MPNMGDLSPFYTLVEPSPDWSVSRDEVDWCAMQGGEHSQCHGYVRVLIFCVFQYSDAVVGHAHIVPPDPPRSSVMESASCYSGWDRFVKTLSTHRNLKRWWILLRKGDEQHNSLNHAVHPIHTLETCCLFNRVMGIWPNLIWSFVLLFGVPSNGAYQLRKLCLRKWTEVDTGTPRAEEPAIGKYTVNDNWSRPREYLKAQKYFKTRRLVRYLFI